MKIFKISNNQYQVYDEDSKYTFIFIKNRKGQVISRMSLDSCVAGQESNLLEILVVLGITQQYIQQFIEKSIQVHTERLKKFGLFRSQV